MLSISKKHQSPRFTFIRCTLFKGRAQLRFQNVIAQSFAVVAPLFALIAIGYGLMRFRLVSSAAGSGLSEFVFVVAIPALLFRTVATADMPKVDPTGYWVSYFAALAISWSIASFTARRMGRDARESAVIGFSAAQSNTVLIGIPLILATLGDAGKTPIVLLILIHLPITMSIVTILIARGDQGKNAVWTLLRSLFTHPILLAIAFGVMFRLSGMPMPDMGKSVMKFLGDAAAPCALVSMGMFMNGISLKGNGRLISVVSLLKLVIHPILVWYFTTKVFHLSPVWAGAAILFAASPTGINAYLVAQRYKSGETVASGAIALTTLLAIITMTIAVAVAMSLQT